MKTVLRKKALIVFSSIQLFGVFSLYSNLILASYLSLLFLALIIVIYDSFQLPKNDQINHSSVYSKYSAPHQIFNLKVSVVIQNAFQSDQVNLLIRNLSIPGLDFDQIKDQEYKNNANNHEFFFEYIFKPSKIGELKEFSYVVEVKSKFGFLSRLFLVKDENFKVLVFPEKAKIPERVFETLVKGQRILKQGVHDIKKSRSAELFHSIRDYRFPDPLRHLDYKKSAKFGTLMTRTFESHSNHHLVICLDVGRSMCGYIKDSKKIDYYTAASYYLSQCAFMIGDQVSFLAFSDKAHAAVSNCKNINTLLSSVFSPKIKEAYEVDSDFSTITKTLPLNSTSRSIVIIFSDMSHAYMHDSLLKMIKVLSKKHLVMVCSLLDQSFEINNKITSYQELENIPESEIANFMYSYWLDDSMKSFCKNADYIGSGALVVPDKYWLSSAEKVYGRLRSSNKL